MQISGKINRIIYRSEDNGYTVAVFDTEDGAIRIAGALLEADSGKRYQLEGDFTVHLKYGEQFSFVSYEEVIPEGKEAIRDFLVSGAIRGVGPKTADLILDKFGEDALRVIEEDPDQLLTIGGIGKVTQKKIIESFGESKDLMNASMALREMGLDMTECAKVYKMYGLESVGIIRENPYLLVDDVRGIGFNKADRIAKNIGIEGDDENRLMCAIKVVLRKWAVNGSTLMPENELLEEVATTLDVSLSSVRDCIDGLIFSGEIESDFVNDEPVIYLYDYFNAEQRTAFNINRIKTADIEIYPGNIENLIDDAEASLGQGQGGFSLSEKQRAAVRETLLNNIVVITGGPGTGKTTIIDTIVKIFERLEVDVALAAPTGRAAKRMEEATGCPAMTVHRLLEYVYSENDDTMSFGRNAENPLEQAVVIVDEASMIDIRLMDGLLEALKSGTRLILTGDADQLPSVGAGNVLRDIIRSDTLPVVRLREIYRQAEDSLIIKNAHRINEGDYPETNGDPDRDFFIISKDSENDILSDIKSLVGGRLAAHYDFIEDAYDIQVLTPTRKGILGSHNLNIILQEVINPASPEKKEFKIGKSIYREGDKVMQLKNNYGVEWKSADDYSSGQGVFNGDMGRVISINEESKSMLVEMDDKLVTYAGEMFEEIELAYAITVHKSQGCEFPAVIIPVWNYAQMLMTRNLLYTGVTRGKRLVILDGSEHCVKVMIDNDPKDERYTGLKEKLEMLDGGIW